MIAGLFCSKSSLAKLFHILVLHWEMRNSDGIDNSASVFWLSLCWYVCVWEWLTGLRMQLWKLEQSIRAHIQQKCSARFLSIYSFRLVRFACLEQTKASQMISPNILSKLQVFSFTLCINVLLENPLLDWCGPGTYAYINKEIIGLNSTTVTADILGLPMVLPSINWPSVVSWCICRDIFQEMLNSIFMHGHLCYWLSLLTITNVIDFFVWKLVNKPKTKNFGEIGEKTNLMHSKQSPWLH